MEKSVLCEVSERVCSNVLKQMPFLFDDNEKEFSKKHGRQLDVMIDSDKCLKEDEKRSDRMCGPHEMGGVSNACMQMRSALIIRARLSRMYFLSKWMYIYVHSLYPDELKTSVDEQSRWLDRFSNLTSVDASGERIGGLSLDGKTDDSCLNKGIESFVFDKEKCEYGNSDNHTSYNNNDDNLKCGCAMDDHCGSVEPEKGISRCINGNENNNNDKNNNNNNNNNSNNDNNDTNNANHGESNIDDDNDDNSYDNNNNNNNDTICNNSKNNYNTIRNNCDEVFDFFKNDKNNVSSLDTDLQSIKHALRDVYIYIYKNEFVREQVEWLTAELQRRYSYQVRAQEFIHVFILMNK